MKAHIPPKENTKEKFQDASASKRPPVAFVLFCSVYCSKIKEHPSLSVGDVAKNWEQQCCKYKQPYEKTTAKIKENMERLLPHTDLKENLKQLKRDVATLERERKWREGMKKGKRRKMKIMNGE